MRATLISCTANPIETLYTIWEQSKTDDPLDVIAQRAQEPGRAEEMLRIVLEQDIPVAENIVFNFVCEDVPIAWREQAVRARVGTKFGEKFAVDIIPDADLSFWSQSHRLKDMSRFYFDREYYTPPSVAGDGETETTIRYEYDQAMRSAQQAYARLVELGVPLEDARNVLPLAATHRIAMTINLKALKNMIGKRGCWILQASLWHPIIASIVDELCAKVHQAFRVLVHPPCVSGGCFRACVYEDENERRRTGADKMPICPLYVTSKLTLKGHRNISRWYESSDAEIQARIPEYAKLWEQPDLAATWRWTDKTERSV